jgi:hypothetical protein
LNENELQNKVDRPNDRAQKQDEDDDLDRRVLELGSVGPRDLSHLVLHFMIELHEAAWNAFALDYFNSHYCCPTPKV